MDNGLHKLAGRPMLICWGMHDFVFDGDYLAEWQRRFPEAEVHRFPNAGHYVLEDAPEHPLFEDVIGITAHAEGKILADVIKLCLAFGYRLTRDGKTAELTGPNLVLRLLESDTHRGIVEMTLRVNGRPAGKTECRFGTHSVLKFVDDSTAVWSFDTDN